MRVPQFDTEDNKSQNIKGDLNTHIEINIKVHEQVILQVIFSKITCYKL